MPNSLILIKFKEMNLYQTSSSTDFLLFQSRKTYSKIQIKVYKWMFNKSCDRENWFDNIFYKILILSPLQKLINQFIRKNATEKVDLRG